MKTKTIIQSLVTTAAAALLFAGCSHEEVYPQDGIRTPVSFSAALQTAPSEAAPHTRTVIGAEGNTVWTDGDAVGVFMLATATSDPAGILAGGDNVQYTVEPATGKLTPAGTPIFYPQHGSVDFVAYYPYMAKGTEHISEDYQANISVTDQSDPASIDLLWAKASDRNKSSQAVNLTFAHLLSKIKLVITLGDGLCELTADKITKVTLVGMPASATLNLLTGSIQAGAAADIVTLRESSPSDVTQATFTALIPSLVASGNSTGYTHRQIVITVDGIEYVGDIPDDDHFLSNTMHVYPVTVQRKRVTVEEPVIKDWTSRDNGTGTGTATEVGKGIEKIRIPAGTFLMGSPATEENRSENETQHEVKLTHSFSMSKYPITNVQYAEFLNAVGVGSDGKWLEGLYPNQRLIVQSGGDLDWGLHFNGTWTPVAGYDNHPAIFITWYGAMEYARWIGGSLPTEAQWEYACRAGTATAYFFGEDASLLADYAWYSENSGDGEPFSEKTHPVGALKPNPWGLYDMCGNVREWCLDHWDGEDNYLSLPSEDPVCTEGPMRIYRGGSHFDRDRILRAANRAASSPTTMSETVGFRVVFD